MDTEDQYINYIDSQANLYKNDLLQIQAIAKNPYNLLNSTQLEKLRQEKECTDQISLLQRIKDHYLSFKLAQQNQIISMLSKTIFLGPIALFKPQLLKQKQSVLKLRSLYELILTAGEQKEQQLFPLEFLQETQTQLNTLLLDTKLQYDFDQFISNIQTINKEDWLSCLSQVVDYQTITEINQTNLEFEISGGSESKLLNHSFELCEQTEKKGQFNYDGDEERTPQQSEQSEQEDSSKTNFSWKKVLEKDNKLDSAGYEASNSDRSKKQGKLPRLPRTKKKGTQEYDTDKEKEDKNRKQTI